MTVGVAWTVTVLPSRTTRIVSCSSRCLRMIGPIDSQVAIAFPLIEAIRSPGRIPAARAGESTEVWSTVVEIFSGPWNTSGDEDQDERETQVHDDAGEHGDESLADRGLAVGAGLVFGIDLFEVGHADDAHVAAGGDGLDAVLGLAPPERPDPRSESEEELGDLHPRLLGGDVVAPLVQHDREDQPDDDGDRDRQRRPDRDQHDHGQRDQQPTRDRLAGLDGWRVVQRILHAVARFVDHGCGAVARNSIRFQNVGDLIDVPGAVLEHFVDDIGDLDPRNPSRQEGLDRDLVGTARVWPVRRRRSGRPRRPGSGTETPRDRAASKVSVPSVVQSIGAEGLGRAGRGRRAPSPIGRRMSGIESCAIVAPSTELDHAVHDRLRVHDHVDPIEAHAEQLVGLDHLEALVHQRRRVDGDLGAHRPRGVLRAQLRSRRIPARRGFGRGTGRRSR